MDSTTTALTSSISTLDTATASASASIFSTVDTPVSTTLNDNNNSTTATFNSTSVTLSKTSTTGQVSSTTTATSNNSNNNNDNTSSSATSSQITLVGVALGVGITLILIMLAGLCFWRRNKKRASAGSSEESGTGGSGSGFGSGYNGGGRDTSTSLGTSNAFSDKKSNGLGWGEGNNEKEREGRTFGDSSTSNRLSRSVSVDRGRRGSLRRPSIASINSGHFDQYSSNGNGKLSLSRRPSIQAFQDAFTPVSPQAQIELMSAYKDSDLAERAFQIAGELSRSQTVGGYGGNVGMGYQQYQNNRVSTEIASVNGGFSGAGNGGVGSRRRMSISSIGTSGSVMGMGIDNNTIYSPSIMGASGLVKGGTTGISVPGPDISTFMVPLRTQKWVFSRKDKDYNNNNNNVATAAPTPTTSWSVIVDRSEVGPAATLAVTPEGKVELQSNINVGDDGGISIQASRAFLSWKDTALAVYKESLAPFMNTAFGNGVVIGGGNSILSGMSGPVVAGRQRSRSMGQHPNTGSIYGGVPSMGGMGANMGAVGIGAGVVSGRKLPVHPGMWSMEETSGRDPWITYLEQASVAIESLCMIEDQKMDKDNVPEDLVVVREKIKELADTVVTLVKTASLVPARIGYEPRACNEMSLKRHDVVSIWTIFDDTYGYG
ncbi:hypothetical protein HDU76_007990, partial [Blyttiomyces sp. JEL0837]